MSEAKSICVTCIVLVLLGIAVFAFYQLCMPVFIILTALFAAVGVLTSACAFCLWLGDAGESGKRTPAPAEAEPEETTEGEPVDWDYTKEGGWVR